VTGPVRVVEPDGGAAAIDRADETVPATLADHGPMGIARGSLAELRAALAMLTRLPLPGSPSVRTGVQGYPLVGALLGLVTLAPLLALGTTVPVVSAILAVAMLAVLSGGLHLDGLADTFDALAAIGPNAAERARKDPAVGAAGATALVLTLAIDVAAVASLLATIGALGAGLACVVAGSVSRLMPPVLARRYRAAAPPDGLGAWFVRRTARTDVIVALASSVVVALTVAVVAGWPELALGGLIGGAVALGVGAALVRLRGQLDGDLLGASVEMAFATTLLATAALAASASA
jgi:adenosylcobinamide-GDP ribazoletransferase